MGKVIIFWNFEIGFPVECIINNVHICLKLIHICKTFGLQKCYAQSWLYSAHLISSKELLIYKISKFEFEFYYILVTLCYMNLSKRHKMSYRGTFPMITKTEFWLPLSLFEQLSHCGQLNHCHFQLYSGLAFECVLIIWIFRPKLCLVGKQSKQTCSLEKGERQQLCYKRVIGKFWLN